MNKKREREKKNIQVFLKYDPHKNKADNLKLSAGGSFSDRH